MILVFLDVDGVLNSEYTTRKDERNFIQGLAALDHKNVSAFKKFIAMLKSKYGQENVKIILSSSWRLNVSLAMTGRPDGFRDMLDEYLERYGLKIDGETEYMPGEGAVRGKEIAEYVKNNPGVDAYVVIDDYIYDDFREYGIFRHLVQTSYESRSGKAGFQDKHTGYALKLLEEQMKEGNKGK
jgi:hypothetical protein